MASIEDISGKEFYAARQLHSDATTRIMVRYRDGIRAEDRIRHDDQDYDIIAVLDKTGRKKQLEIIARKLENKK